MKFNSILLPLLTSAAVFIIGCGPDKEPTSAATPKEVASATKTPTNPPAPPSATVASASVHQGTIRIKAGPGAPKDSSGNQWLEEQGFGGGDVIDRPDVVITNTPDAAIYRSEHYAMDSFTYHVPNGKYQVKLHFCETYEGIAGPGERVFSFTVEDKSFKDFDVWAKAGGGGRAYVETVNVDITDGQLDIKFTPQVENPEINGIEISPVK